MLETTCFFSEDQGICSKDRFLQKLSIIEVGKKPQVHQVHRGLAEANIPHSSRWEWLQKVNTLLVQV